MLRNVALRALIFLDSIESRISDEDGQTLAEYGLIMAVIAIAVVVSAVVAFRGAIVSSFNKAKVCLSGSC